MLPKYESARQERRTTEPPHSSSPDPFPRPELVGRWTGTVRTYEGAIPLTLVCRADGDIHVKLGDQLWSLLNEVSYQGDYLVGRFVGAIPTRDQSRHPHNVLLNVRLHDHTLSGQASAQATDELMYYALTSYVELTKARELSASELTRYTGSYTFSVSGNTRRVFEEADMLKIERPSGVKSLLYQENHTFIAMEDAIQVIFQMEGEEIRGLILTTGGQAFEEKRIK